MPASDYVFVGSGINSLVCAAMLAGKGARVLVLERSPRFGGCIRTEELTRPGFVHDVLSSWYPAFVASGGYGAVGRDLHRHGLEFCNTDRPAGVMLSDGRHFCLRRDRGANIEALNAVASGDGDRYAELMHRFEQTLDLTLAVLTSDLSLRGAARTAARALLRHRRSASLEFAAGTLQSARTLLESTFSSDVPRAFFAPWVLHAGLGPEAAGSAQMMRLLPYSLELVGMPLVRGGSSRIVDAFGALITERGGTLVASADVERIEVHNGHACGAHTSDGTYYAARRGVICNVVPGQLYGRLLAPGGVPEPVMEAARKFRHSRACMQIHMALREPPRWSAPELDDVAYIHVTDGLDGVSRAVNEADRGLLPAAATIAVAQPSRVDPSRAPQGSGVLWVQLLELPSTIRGDAAGRIGVPADGRWNASVREAYADRIMEHLSRHVTNLGASLIARSVVSPADLEAMNINLVGGDPFGGDRSVDQLLFSRSPYGRDAWTTPIRGLYHIGASQYPGHNLGAGSGFGLAQRLR
jgi:phytoene dehydrogenase-like protein